MEDFLKKRVESWLDDVVFSDDIMREYVQDMPSVDSCCNDVYKIDVKKQKKDPQTSTSYFYDMCIDEIKINEPYPPICECNDIDLCGDILRKFYNWPSSNSRNTSKLKEKKGVNGYDGANCEAKNHGPPKCGSAIDMKQYMPVPRSWINDMIQCPWNIEFDRGFISHDYWMNKTQNLLKVDWPVLDINTKTKNRESERKLDLSNSPRLYYAICCHNYDMITELVESGVDIFKMEIKSSLPSGYYNLLEKAIRLNLKVAEHLIKLILIKNYTKGSEAMEIKKYFTDSRSYCKVEDFVKSCGYELSLMSSHMVGSFSIFDLYKNIVQYHNIKPLYKHHNIVENIKDRYPIYYDIILPKMKMCMDRAFWLSEMKHRRLSLCSYTAHEDTNGKTVSLNYDCILRIFEYLSNEDLSVFISLFDNPSGYQPRSKNKPLTDRLIC